MSTSKDVFSSDSGQGWRGMTLEQLESHLGDLRDIGLTPTAAFLSALRQARREAKEASE